MSLTRRQWLEMYRELRDIRRALIVVRTSGNVPKATHPVLDFAIDSTCRIRDQIESVIGQMEDAPWNVR